MDYVSDSSDFSDCSSSDNLFYVSMLPLQKLCLYSIFWRFDEYGSQSLALLPPTLRFQVLLHLPVADIVKLEKCLVFMEGVDSKSLWRSVGESRLYLPYNISVKNCIPEFCSSYKELYFMEVLVNLLTWSRWFDDDDDDDDDYIASRFHGSHVSLIAFMLFGLKSKIYTESIAEIDLMGNRWIVPDRYIEVANISHPVAMAWEFFEQFQWYPGRINLYEEAVLLDISILLDDRTPFRLLLSRVETVSLCYYHHRDHYIDRFVEDNKLLWNVFASLEESSLRRVVLHGYVKYICEMIDAVSNGLFKSEQDITESDGQNQRISDLKEIEFFGRVDTDIEGSMSDAIVNSIPFLNFQTGLETLIVEGLCNIDEVDFPNFVKTFEYFEPFYNYLPHFISKPSFKKLRLTKCKIPINSLKSLISTFLCSATQHKQTLELPDFEVAVCSEKRFSKEFPLVNQEANKACVAGQNKYLCINSCSDFSPKWIFEYPHIQLKRLEITSRDFDSSNLTPFEVYPKSSIETLCCKFISLSKGSEVALYRFLQLQLVSEIEVIEMFDKDDTIISVLTNALSNRIPLKRIQLKSFSCKELDMKQFFNALFSLPNELLAEFSLELITLVGLIQDEILYSWRANCDGQKIKNLVVKLYNPISALFEDGETPQEPLYELNDVAIECRIESVVVT